MIDLSEIDQGSIPAVSTIKRSNPDHSRPTKTHIKQGLSSSLTNLPQVVQADDLTHRE